MTTSELRSGSRSLTSSLPRAAVARQLILRARLPGRGTGYELDAFAGDRSRTAAGYWACRPGPGEPSQPLDRRVDPQRRGRLDDELGATEVKLIARGQPDRRDAEGAPARAVDRVLERPRLARMEREHAPRGRSVPIEAFRQPQLDVEPGACVRRGKRQLELDPRALDHAIGRDPDGRFGSRGAAPRARRAAEPGNRPRPRPAPAARSRGRRGAQPKRRRTRRRRAARTSRRFVR